MKTRWQTPAVLSLLCAPLLGCESLDIKHEAAASRNAAFRAEPIADRCERNFRLRPIQSKEDAASWLSKCGNFDRWQTVAEVREAYDRYALAECRTKSEAAQTSAALDKLKYFCGEYLDDPVIQASMGRRSQLETSELLADLDTIGTGAASYRYQQFLDRHKNISRDNPAVVRAESLLKRKVSGFEDFDDDGELDAFKTDATVAGGNSGGLAINTAGQQIGIPSYGQTKDGNAIGRVRMINLAEPYIQKALQLDGVDDTKPRQGNCEAPFEPTDGVGFSNLRFGTDYADGPPGQ